MACENGVTEMMGGEVRLWIDQGVVMLKAVTARYHDPVELTTDAARRLAQILTELAETVDAED